MLQIQLQLNEKGFVKTTYIKSIYYR